MQEELKKKLAEIQSNEKMVKEDVDSEEIADVISKWTGIPFGPLDFFNSSSLISNLISFGSIGLKKKL